MLHFIDKSGAPGALTKSIRIAKVSRRAFLGGATFAIGAYATGANAFPTWKTGGEDMPHGIVDDPLIFVSIDPDGTVTLVAHRSEMGTGSKTSLPMIMADEMEADWARVKIVQAEGDEPKYGNQDTDGSRSLRHHIQMARKIGGSVRHMMREAAAKEWGVPANEVVIEMHEALHGDKSLGFGDLAAKAMAEPVPSHEEIAYKSEAEFRYIGKGEVGMTDLRGITTGGAIYGADVTVPGMKFAAIARPPVVGGKVKSVDDKAALAIPGVESVHQLAGSIPPAKFAPLGGVAVIASNTWAALEGRDALQIEWDDGPHGEYDSAAFMEEMKATAEKPGVALRTQGDPEKAFADAAKVISQTYTQDHMAHIPMEPPVALASVTPEGCEVWAPVQSPYATRTDVAEALGLDISKVKVNVTLLGGGFGRKSKADFATEAALLSRAVGAPVRVQWTRQDDIHHSFYHTTSAERVSVALDAENKVVGWRHNSVAPSILTTFAPDTGHQFPVESGMGHVDVPFAIPNILCENGEAKAHTRIGWFRSVSNIPRAWAIGSFVSELAAELGKDEREMWLELIGSPRKIDPAAEGFPDNFWDYGEPYDGFPIETGRLANVLNVAADAMGASGKVAEGEGIGLAVHRCFVSYVGCAARVKIVDGRITVPEMHLAIDCGFVANPERVESQMQGAAVMGMTAAMFSSITYEKGRVVQSNFHDYDVVRSDNYPINVVTHMIANPFSVHSTGVGEPGVPPVPPAIANGLFHATGQRRRALPFGDTV